MYLFYRKSFLFCFNRALFIKLSTSNGLFNYTKCLSYSQPILAKKKNLSALITPCSVEACVDKAGEELCGKLPKEKLLKVINSFYRKPELKILAKENNIDGYFLQNGFVSFRKYCIKSENLPADLHIILSDILNGGINELDLFPFFLRHVKEVYPHLNCLEELKKIGDLTTPHNWYPEAREKQRTIIFHCGPTNSGKTYHAIKSFFNAESGIYCGPLKLLAMEIYNKANENGVPCDLVTGEEIVHCKATGDEANHVSCTIEMCSLERKYDVAIIDEIQMIKDIQRGWAWTRALLGLKAKEIHLCGEESVFDLLDSMLCSTNENLEVKKYKRLTELEMDIPVENFDNIIPGDCIVCFNKRDIFYVSEILEKKGKEVAVIYGALPPGAKVAQCKKFNDVNHPCKIMVATDAIGMGLNLSIRRIIFYSLNKISMDENRITSNQPISVSQALQIAGRAGRYGSQYQKGFVTTFKQKDLPLLQELLLSTPEAAVSAGLLPTLDQIELYSFYLPTSTLSNLMDIFINLCTVDDSMYFICDIKVFQLLAESIEHLPLPLRVKYVFCCAPINIQQNFTCSIFRKFAKMYSENTVITSTWLCKTIKWPIEQPKSISELVQLESVHDCLDLYLWLRFPSYFPHGDAVKDIQKELDKIIQEGISKIINLLKTLKKDLSQDINELDSEDSKVIISSGVSDLIENMKSLEHLPDSSSISEADDDYKNDLDEIKQFSENEKNS